MYDFVVALYPTGGKLSLEFKFHYFANDRFAKFSGFKEIFTSLLMQHEITKIRKHLILRSRPFWARSINLAQCIFSSCGYIPLQIWIIHRQNCFLDWVFNTESWVWVFSFINAVRVVLSQWLNSSMENFQ